MKRFLTPIVLVILLTACGSNDDAVQKLSNSKTYSTDTFSIDYPLDWKFFDQNNLPLGIPKGTLAAFENNVKNEVFTANVHVRENILSSTGITSVDYVKSLLASHRETLLNFSEITREEKEPGTLFVVFEAKENAAADLKRFFQTAIITENTAYVVTGAALQNDTVDVFNALESTVSSFRLNE